MRRFSSHLLGVVFLTSALCACSGGGASNVPVSAPQSASEVASQPQSAAIGTSRMPTAASGNVASPPLPANLPNGGALGAAQRSASSVAPQWFRVPYKSLYSFKGGTDGANPSAGLIAVYGELYGTTGGGGTYGHGTVFKVSTFGTETVLYRFKGVPDGAFPVAGLIEVNGALYGTTQLGGTYGAYGDGTVFKMSTSGAESVLYRFKNVPDGANPEAGLIDVNGAL
jgi:uncharacterized repeat protein (TIGR03803 family)